jgi:hypothetical protein
MRAAALAARDFGIRKPEAVEPQSGLLARGQSAQRCETFPILDQLLRRPDDPQCADVGPLLDSCLERNVSRRPVEQLQCLVQRRGHEPAADLFPVDAIPLAEEATPGELARVLHHRLRRPDGRPDDPAQLA